MTNRLIILSIYIFFLFTTIEAQDYIPVIINGDVFFKTELETSDGLILSEVTVANFEKINGVLYNRVFFKRGFEADMFVGHLREEPGLGRLYFRPLTSDEDFLIYDISLEVGNIINLSARWCDDISGDAAQVIEVIEQEGAKEIVFNRQIGEQDICMPLRFIEGVGPNASVIFPFFRDALIQNGAAQRLCHASHAAIIYYPDAESDFCGFDITPTNDLVNQRIEIFPNPAHDFISITQPMDNELECALIYNTQGKLVWKGKIEGEMNVNISSMPSGLYHLVLNGKDGVRYSERFVKE